MEWILATRASVLAWDSALALLIPERSTSSGTLATRPPSTIVTASMVT